MENVISWRKDENFHKEDFDRFMREAATQAEKIQVQQRYTLGHHHNRVFERPRNKNHSAVIKNKSHPHIQQSSTRTDSESRGVKRKRERVSQSGTMSKPKV